MNAEDLALELIDIGLVELVEDTDENSEFMLVIHCGFTDFGSIQKALEENGSHPIVLKLNRYYQQQIP